MIRESDVYPKICPICGKSVIEEEDDICPVCYWQSDPVQEDDPPYAGGANNLSLNQYREEYRKKSVTFNK